MAEEERKIIPSIIKENILELLKEGKRIDGRKLFEFRKLRIIPGPIEKAEGSALVLLGNTKVLVGVKMSLGKPFPDTPNEGVLVVNAEFQPVASPYWELGPNEYAIELARVVDRAIRSSGMVALDELVIHPGELCWVINVDIYPIDDNGNLIDTALIGAVAALLTTRVPEIDFSSGKPQLKREEGKPLPIRDIPISCTFAKIGEQMVLDPNKQEECLMSARLTIAVNSANEICTIQKMKGGGFTIDDIIRAKDITIQKAKDLRREIQKQVAEKARGEEIWKEIREVLTS